MSLDRHLKKQSGICWSEKKLMHLQACNFRGRYGQSKENKKIEGEMEPSREKGGRRGDGPCFFCCCFCDKVIRVILKCFCLGHESFSPLDDQPTNNPQPQGQTKTNEDEERAGEAQFTRSITVARGRPPRPPVSSGRGGQIN